MKHYTDTNQHTLHTALRRAVMMGVCALATLCTVPTMAQVVIGGDVYGGGKEGAVNNNTSAANATSVTIQGTQTKVRTVFGGGQKGAVTGNTTVSINGGTIGAKALEGTPYGGVYGGGEGAAATVTGSTNVTISGGDNYNNVYGGGKQALLEGNAHVTLIGGQVRNNVFAGACMANINGYALVDIQGGSANQLLIKAVYGGNDISGSILNSSNATPTSLGYSYKVTSGLPTPLESFVFAQPTATNAFVGNVFGGGNGAYQYGGSEGSWSVTMKDLGTGTVTFTDLPNKPVAPHAYLQIEGGTYGSIYGGGNEATISERTDIYFGIGMNGDNYADVEPMKNIPAEALSWLDLYEGYTMNEGGTTFNMKYNAYRIFGGNNIADMAIRPTWHLKSGMVGNIYSGGNQGRMTYEKGLFLPLTSNHIKVNNVYGGCRMADVNPGGANGNGTIAGETITYHRFKHAEGDKFAESYNATYEFAEGYAARVLVLAGQINNLYGGNDISGKVYYGTNVELRGAISGDVYGGGNGSYAYTDNAEWIKNNPQDADYYYTIPEGSNSWEALYNYRPHVEKTLLHITGIDAAAPPVYVTGGVYCGGNSATLDGASDKLTAKFKIGQKVYINGVFLGSNGENMISEDILKKYATENFSSMKLKGEGNCFAEYMKGVSVNLIPEIEWEWDDSDNLNKPGQTEAGGINSFIGAFYCGGNVGSMTTPYQMNMTFPRCLTVYDRIVGGCNSANISKSSYNAALEGGVTNEFTNGTSKEDNKAKVVLNVRSRLEPGKLTVEKDSYGFLLDADYDLNTKNVNLESAANVPVYVGANVYGGCYASGYVNGDVEINIADDLISPNVNKEILNRTADYVYASAMAIYGGGYGTGTEIRGNTKLNFSDKARVLLAFGGGQMGQVGNHTIKGNTVVNFDKDLVLPGDDKDNLNVYRAYAGGYAGTITGNTTLKLLGGGVMRAFAGACNADINGYATAIVGAGTPGVPYVAQEVIGGNDFGGKIIGSNTWDIEEDVQNKSVTSQTYVQYLSGKIGRAIYGGSYGSYDYDNKTCYPENVDGEPVTRPVSAPTLSSTFVDIASQSTNPNDIIGSDNSESILTLVAGGGRGYKGLPEYVKVDNTYVLLRGKNRATPMAHRIYGGGNLSSVGNTLVEAYSGNYSQIFGGTHGVLTETATDLTSYDNTTSTINVYDGINNAQMDIFGAGANSGTTGKIVDEKLVGTTINLLGGTMRDVHGGAFTEGYTSATTINVLEGSTAQVNALFGGGLGSEEGRPCDVGQSKIIFASADAKVETGIYGGNHTARVTKNSNIVINVPVTNIIGEFRNVYGAGLGEHTVSGFTSIDLQPRAKVANVYGGGEEGKVYNHYSYYNNTGAISNFYSGTGASKHAHWETNDNADNTLIAIREGAIVTNNVYGGGKGAVAYASGKTHVQLLGGSVEGDIYGGGDAGAMPRMTDATNGYISEELVGQTIATYCQIDGGEVRNVFGGGFKGNTEGDTYVAIGSKNADARFVSGKPTIQRSAYGGGEMAKVTGKATVNMWNGYIGYEYVGGDFKPLLDIEGSDKKLLKENGNLYGAGYGEGAVVMQTFVNLHGGVIRNGLYGGGEIAAVGVGATKLENDKYVLDTSKNFVAGKTHVRMYGGTVEGDVFGGGRGFSYDLTGNQVTGKIYYTDGYVFGQTDVEIYRGTIGTDASLEEGHGNVFGGGNIGYVYGGTADGRSVQYTGVTDATNAKFNGHYYKNNSWATRTEDCHVHIEARCKVLEAVPIGGTPYAAGEYVPVEELNKLRANAEEWKKLDQEGITIRNAVFAGGNVSSGSDKIYANAVTIYGNATASVVDVFAKDFISVGGDGVGGLYGDGNLTFVDGYRELNITNYGTDFYNLDADLTYAEYLLLSDREKGFYNLLYSPKTEISFEFEGVHYIYHAQQGETAADEIDEHEFKTMLNAYIQKKALEMTGKWNQTDNDGTVTYTPTQEHTFKLGNSTYTYSKGTSYTAAQYDEMMANYKLYIKQDMEAKWDINGECSLTAGRMLNTIQRADFCGMFGSRIMLYGAQDRVPEIVDYTKYTINRVGEVSLNQRKAAYDNTEIHGNYFGIYNVVNLLGALTSDVKFTDVREDVGILEEGLKADGKKYIQYKYDKLSTDPRARNMASSKNMVAQASGVFLELVKEVDDDGNKTYGPVTGVIQLDLINVKPGEGGGYVYAKNEHHAPTTLASDITARQVLSRDNQGAVSYANFVYDGALQAMQTSGNFVHPTKRIVDECFPRGGYYTPGETNYSNAHFWYIRGDFYVYDQYVSGYTGAAQAYEQDIEIPLTIAAGSEGRMTLQSVNPSKYAYFVGKHYGDKVLTANDNILVEDKTYYLNDPISYWDWSQLSITDQAYFVDETYVAICDAMIGTTEYKKGHVLLPADYENLVTSSGNVAYIKDLNGNYQVGNDTYKEATTHVFRISNEISHDAGYLITFDITNPLEWDNYYTKLNKGDGNIEKMLESEYKARLTAGTINAQDYTIAPTLLCTKSGIYGQREYALDDLVNEAVFNSQNGIANSSNSNIQSAYNAIIEDQAQFSPAYVVTADELSFTHGTDDYHMFVGSYISKTLYDALDASLKNASNFEPAYICINTIEVADKEYVLNGQLIPASRYTQLKGLAQVNANTFMYGKADTNGELSRYFSPAYVCTEDGKYGGSYFEEKKNYRALDFCGLSSDERNAKNQAGVNVFTYNFDAFDLLATDFDPDIREYKEPYWNTQAVNYTATYSGTGSYTLYMRKGASDTYDGSLKEAVTINNGTTYQRAEYEQILNEKSHYMPIKVDDVNVAHYVVNETFEKANVYYPVGKVISAEEYSKLSDLLKEKVTVFAANTFNSTGTTYYYCTEKYNMSEQSSAITNCIGGGTTTFSGKGTTVLAGTVISQTDYNDLPNYQNGFIIQGHAPIQTTTIYVPRESDINNLSQDRVITVVYRYDYKEGEGTNITHHSEKHIINIHLEFRSGQPTIGDVTPPATVLPNSVVGLSVPSVKRGAYEILGGGWEIFETPEDAYEHKNGVDYKNNATPMYWYQNNYYVAYYAKTYLGKTYSNPVPFSVANYHRLGEVMNHEQRMYIDHKDVDRASKIYLDAAPYPTNSIAADYDENDPLISPNGKRDGKNDLDYLYDLYQETKNGRTSVVEPTEPYVFNPRIKNASNLEFILRSDIAPKKYAETSSEGWKQIGDSENCFAGTLHGNGYTISGLDKSLFNYLCGKVYNLGVTGSFTGGGVADHGGTNGHAENCWVYTTAKLAENTTTKAVIGNGGKIVNSYYLADNGFATGGAIAKTKSDFEKGEVAYQLNRFHLHKRFSDKDNNLQAQGDAYKYMYYASDENDELVLNSSYYTSDYAIYSHGGGEHTEYKGYVEDYYFDGDFIYANGEIPLTVNERLDQEDKMYYPIYPDDYIFFGQRLSYQDATHDDLPVRIKKQTVENKERIVRVLETANRVYRAPAYYKSKKKKEAYFNVYAAFVDKYEGTLVDHDMTAIDFTGYYDADYTDNQSSGVFYSPVLDYEGLSDITITGLTPNLLVYANTADTKTYNVLSDNLKEPELSIGTRYAEIAPVLQTQMPHGHLVDFTGGEYKATRDHFLVDKENFNAPIAYAFDEDYYMWYQRTPDRFAESGSNGWDVISLPFTAGLVTTHQKGEITHFYGNSTKMHEYWLREFMEVKEGENTKAVFTRPAEDEENSYEAENRFLYDYYYSKSNDKNTDIYQDYYSQDYYSKEKRKYDNYAYLTAATPYIVAFPGKHYYEFDMSGEFVPQNTYTPIDQLEKQVVTMVSTDNTTIAVTDDENLVKEVNGYQFVGTYQKKDVNGYLVKADGSAFEAANNATTVPFRGYLIKSGNNGSAPRRILIGNATEEEEPIEDITNRGLTIYGKKDAIYIESTLEHETTVIIYGLSGQVIARVKVQPMSKEVVTVPSRGVYIVNKRKVAVL